MIADPDYITVTATMHPHKHLVMLMHWSRVDDGYVAVRCSQELSEVAARALAEKWATYHKLEIR